MSSFISDKTVEELTLAVVRGEMTLEEGIARSTQAGQILAAAAAGKKDATPGADENTDRPWAKNLAQDKRIDLEKVSDALELELGISQDKAIQMAIRLSPAEQAGYIKGENDRFNARAEAKARADWEASPEGLEALGKAKIAEDAQIAERAQAIRAGLEAKGTPLPSAEDGFSDREVLDFIAETEAKREQTARDNDLQANIEAATAAPNRWGDAPAATGEGA